MDNVDFTTSNRIIKETRRVARSPQNPFDQQQQDVSGFVLKDQSTARKRKTYIPSRVNTGRTRNHDEENTHRDTFRAGRERIPIYPPISLHDDTLVNDVLLENETRRL